MAQPEIVKTAQEVQRAHDLLIEIILAENRNPLQLGQDEIDDIKAYTTVLCWLLGHQYNTVFEDNLHMLEEGLKKLGFSLFDAGRLVRVQ